MAQAICHPLIGRALAWSFRDRIPCQGSVIETRDPAVVPSIKASIFWGFYERPERRFVGRYLRRDLDVIDLGSSLGVVSAAIARRLAEGRRLVCVEPNPALHDVLCTNLQRNAPPGVRWTIVPAALYYTGDIATPPAAVDLALGVRNLGARVGPAADGQAAVRVPTTRLSALLDEHGIGQFTLVADIEGAEAGLFACEADALVRCRQMIVELHVTIWEGRPVSIETMRAWLEGRHGFVLRDRSGSVCVYER